MVIGVFFSEVGTELLAEISKFDSKSRKTSNELIINANWADEDFINAKKEIENRKYHLEIHGDIPDSIKFLNGYQGIFNQQKNIFTGSP